MLKRERICISLSKILFKFNGIFFLSSTGYVQIAQNKLYDKCFKKLINNKGNKIVN